MSADLIVLITVVLIASILQTSTGYGFSIIGTPFLLLMYPVHTAIQINIVLSICLSAAMIFKIRKEVDTVLLMRLIKGSIVVLLIGIFVYLYININLLKMSVGLLIVVLTILLILQWTIKRTIKRDLMTGSLSGLLTTSVGVPGPPLLLYFSGAKMDVVTLRSTTLAYYLFVYVASLMMQITFCGTNKQVWTDAMLALPALFAGVFLGQWLFKRISQAIFLLITYLILIGTGIYLFLSGMY